MGLREIAEADLAFILEDAVTGFGWEIALTNPDGDTANLTGYSNDISQVIDPDTGQIVSGRLATVALRISGLDSTVGRPVGVSDAASKPWLVDFDDIFGANYSFKVKETNPDNTLGVVVCILEAYKP